MIEKVWKVYLASQVKVLFTYVPSKMSEKCGNKKVREKNFKSNQVKNVHWRKNCSQKIRGKNVV